MATVEIILTGPSGDNPLGFLCALGALRTLSNAWPDAEVKMKWQQIPLQSVQANFGLQEPDAEVKMKWQQIGTPWRPVLRASHANLDDKEEAGQKQVVVNAIFNELKNMDDWHPAKKWQDTHNIKPEDYRGYSLQAQDRLFDPRDHRSAEWAATIACDAIIRDKAVEDTAFRTMSGQGHQHFLKQIKSLKEKIQVSHLEEALFGPWQYKDDKLNLRLDPTEDRRHALRWKSPDKDPIKTVWGANCLAAEGLPMYPVFPQGRRLRTVGFRGNSKDAVFWTWPIWNAFADVSLTRSLLALPALQADRPARAELSPLGIVEVYRAQRILIDRYRVFTMGQPH
ncbi:MAG: hypothetical protein KatS3mg052_2032 [Candidatus Roseilinea sp.]|nr:MAG: hypothetical protein KatS3mg052_2032 [Candidatus Roseilinea sp.]